MNTKYNISDEEFESVYNFLKEKITANLIPNSESKVAVVLGGQPGAGKSNIYQTYKKELNYNIAAIDCDTFRKYHPFAKVIEAEHPNQYAELTNDFVFALSDRLSEELTNEGYNIITESSLKSPHSAQYAAETYKNRGYSVHLAIMATNKDTAWQGTLNRAEEAKQKGEIPRYVDRKFYDFVVNNICNSLDCVYNGHDENGTSKEKVDNIRIFTRFGTELYNMERTPELNPVPILQARLFHPKEEAKNIIDSYIQSSSTSNMYKSGHTVLDNMVNDSNLYNEYLKFQGGIFKQNTCVALEFFAQKPDVQFVATAAQWTKAGYKMYNGCEGLLYTHTDGTIHEFFDFSQVNSDTPPTLWTIDQSNVNAVKSQLGISEQTPITNGLIRRYVTNDNVIRCMNRLNIPKGKEREFVTCYTNAIRTIIAGRLEVGGNKFEVSADNSILGLLSHEQRMVYISFCTQTARNALFAVEKAVNSIERMKNNDLRSMDGVNDRGETKSTNRRITGNTDRTAEKRSDIVESDKDREQRDNVGNSAEINGGRREEYISGISTEDANGKSADVVQVQPVYGNLLAEHSGSGTVNDRRTDRTLRAEMDGVHGIESLRVGGHTETGTQISDARTDSGTRSDGIQDTAGRTIRKGESETDRVRRSTEMGNSENDAHRQYSDEGKGSGVSDEITNSSFSEKVNNNTETSVNSTDVFLRTEESVDYVQPSLFDDTPPAHDVFGNTYRLLSRLQMDCEYFFGAGNGTEKHLYTENIESHIAKMHELFDKLPEDRKPEWISKDDINNYDIKMHELLSDKMYASDPEDHADDDLLEISYAENPAQRFADNIAAINRLKYLEQIPPQYEFRITDYDKDYLRRYVGWGGLSQIFDENNDENRFRRTQLKGLLSDEEYNAAKSSTLNAHYTPQVVIDAMYNAVKAMELPRNARILEPACGTGNFITRLPASLAANEVIGIELDSLTSRITDMLNRDKENITIINSGFENAGLENNSFDLAIGNVPFGNYNLTDPEHSDSWKIHDAFFRKALDKVAPGGVVAFITSTGTLDKKNPKVREYLAQKSDLIGAIRLPNNTFSDAGTKTATDIIFLQKREHPRLKTDKMPDWCYIAPNKDGLRINSYFIQNPQMVLGTIEQTSHFNMLTCSPTPGADLKEQLDEAIKNLNAKITVKKREDAAMKRQGMIEPWGNNFSYQITDNGVFYRENNTMKELKLNKATEEKLSLLCNIRSAARELVDLQRTSITDDKLNPYRQKLNELYDKYTGKYGNITSRKTTQAFGLDADFPLVLALEEYNKQTDTYDKSEIFRKRTVSPYVTITDASSLEDALQISMDRKGKIDVTYMAYLLKDNQTNDIAAELVEKGYAFNDPDKMIAGEPYSGLTDPSEYLSGNVRMKLKSAEYHAKSNPEYNRNVEALRAVLPEDLKADEITIQMGCAWIDTEDYTEFLSHLSGRKNGLRNCDVTYSAITGEYTINHSRSKIGLNVNETTTYGTADLSLYSLAEKTLNQRRIVVKRNVPDPRDPSREVSRTDVKATKLALDKAKLIKQEFKKWIFADEKRKEKYERRYNDIFNSLVGRSYDGSKLSFPGMVSDFVLRPHQKDCVARTIYGGNTLAAHVVGAGKSAVIISSVMKKKDMGLINKACVVVPKPLTEQTANEWRKLYPDAKVLTVTNDDLSSEDKRKIFTARVATGSYDAVIVSQEQFEKLSMSKEYRAEYIRDQLDELEEYLSANKENRYGVKDIETRKKKLLEKLEKATNPITAAKSKDNLLEFESLGFDYLVVDEAHAYKNGFVMTKMNNVAGVTTRPSGRAEDMQMKTNYFNQEFGQGHILFATGTPVSNSMTELYVMTRYLRPDLLKAAGVDRFDDWAATFGNVVTKNQQSADGRLKLKTKFASFANLPELMSMYKEFADIQSAEKLNLPRPKLKNDKIEIIKAYATPEQKAYVKQLAERAKAYESGMVDSSEDNHLKITGEARLVGLGNIAVKALYERRGETLPADFVIEKNSKVDLCVQKVSELYQQTNETKGVQIIFSDIAVNSNNGNFSAYDYIKKELVEHGIPEDEIIFAPKSDAKNREQIFSDINNSKYRVVIASTDTLGTGANIQQNLYALHHLDTPWKPSDFTQREGRILRQGNKNPEVEIFNYITENTLDSYLYQTVTDKARFIAQLLDNSAPARVSEDCDEKVLSFAEIQAAAEGNPDFKRRIELSNEIAELTMLKNEYFHETALAKQRIDVYTKNIQTTKERIENNSEDLAVIRENPSQEMKIVTHNGVTITDKKDINKYLLNIAKEQAKNPDNPSPIFTANNFTVTAKSYPVMLTAEPEVVFEVSNKLTYKCDAGTKENNDNYTRLNNVFSSVIPKKSEELAADLNELEVNLKQSQTRIDIPFPHEETLDTLTEEYHLLEEKLINLSAEADDITDSDEPALREENSTEDNDDEISNSGITR